MSFLKKLQIRYSSLIRLLYLLQDMNEKKVQIMLKVQPNLLDSQYLFLTLGSTTLPGIFDWRSSLCCYYTKSFTCNVDIVHNNIIMSGTKDKIMLCLPTFSHYYLEVYYRFLRRYIILGISIRWVMTVALFCDHTIYLARAYQYPGIDQFFLLADR